MTQQRFTVFGNDIDAQDLPSVISSLFYAGRLTGNVFGVSGSNLLTLSAGACLLPNGTIILEDEVKSITVPLSSQPAQYTVAYQSEDDLLLGGSPATLALISGLYRQSALVTSTLSVYSVVLGWLLYPGNSIPLAVSQFKQPEYLRVVPHPETFMFKTLAPFSGAIRNGGWNETTAYNTAIGEVLTKWQSPINTLGSLSTQSIYLPFIIEKQPQKLSIRAQVDMHCTLAVNINVGGVSIPVVTNLSNVTTLNTLEYDLPFNSTVVWTKGATASIEVNISSIQSARSASLSYIALTTEQTPFSLFN